MEHLLTLSMPQKKESIRPEYPPWTVPFWSFLKAYGYQSALACTLLTYLFFETHLRVVSKLRSYKVSDQVTFTLLLSVSHTLVYIIVNGTFSSGWQVLEQFKFRRTPGQVPSRDLIKNTLITALVSHFISSPVMTYFLWPYFVSFGMKALDAPLPPWNELVLTYLCAHAFNDFGFYWTHRLLHTPLFYKSVHKQHHEYAGSLGIAAEYAHPIEVLLSNILPSLGGVVFPIGGCQHPLCIVVWLSMRLFQTYCAHSGLALHNTLLEGIGFGHVESACFHDHHHTVNKGNYGSMVTDWMFGTLDDYIVMGYAQGYAKKNGVEIASTKTKENKNR